ncbi:MAG: hypothetical protein P4L31_06040 [Candidatus Babeliales bacterium]|nr:hypothetical protein [Candidatus Babeliales bacterium]
MNMFRRLLLLLVMIQPAHNALSSHSKPLKVLHLSFHLGCVKEFEMVGKELGLDVTPWYVLANKESHDRFDPSSASSWNAVYNIGHARAQCIWEHNKDYFDQFDVIVTSDTAPLSRVFLQNNWQKPLIIWICNRFDYCDQGSLDCRFPDAEYYDLIRKAAHKKNVSIVGYVAYEHFYAKSKGVDTGDLIIKPCGTLEGTTRNSQESYISKNIKKNNTFFIPPRLEPHQVNHLISKCKQLGIDTYCGSYNGPADLKDFKGVINFPYAWSNLALFENIQLGLPIFVPTVRFLNELAGSRESHLYRFFTFANFEYSEWYCPEHKDIFIYFDSWQDLQKKAQTIDFIALKEKTKAFGMRHKQEMLNRWIGVFDNARTILKKITTVSMF